ncbi:MAG: hypothetical protein AB4426_24445 [Xenococcaceae cyanobacterium]
MDKVVTLEQVLKLARELSLVDKVRLIEQVTPQIKQGVKVAPGKPRKSLRGLWQGLDITESDIAEARREMWGNFPRKDI